MFLTLVTFVVALSLSAIAAYYSIAGLVAIFAAAVVPIMIMGGILEVAKLNATLWLHRYWGQCRWVMKLYLVPAVVMLMFITSMGIFGFLSKAHLDQALPTGDVAAKVQLIDDKISIQRELIKTERDNIAAARATLAQMDAQVNARLDRGTSEASAERAVQIRAQQRRERSDLTKEIGQAQQRIEVANKAIADLNVERAPIASDLRKVEAEVGPIKYIAALIYGDHTDQTLLERAVRWVIIILVAVFDPLAVMLLLAASESLGWERQRKLESKDEIDPVPALAPEPTPDPPPESVPEPEPAYEPDDGPLTEEQIEQIKETTKDALPPLPDPAPDPIADPEPLAESTAEPVAEIVVEPVLEPAPDPAVESADEDIDPEGATEQEKNILRKAKGMWKVDNPGATLKEQRRLFDAGKIPNLPWEDYIPKVLASQTSWGRRHDPAEGSKGDLWIDVSSMPSRLYKHNGDTWIEVDKNLTDQYVYANGYIQYLIEQIDQGQYDPDLLTESEKREIETQLKPAV